MDTDPQPERISFVQRIEDLHAKLREGSYLLLIAEDTPFLEIPKYEDVNVCGAIFPRVIFKGKTYGSGIIVAKLSSTSSLHIFDMDTPNPLQTKSEGSVANDIFFEGVLFPAGTELAGTYKFNSYRLTYRYDLVQKSKIEFGLGFTAKIRDAKISLSSTDLYSEKTNVGFVPILNFRLLWKVDDKLGLLLDGDALAAQQGRAEDVLIAATYKHSNNFSIRAGYRILEGGADNEEVYNLALFHYAAVGLSYTFKSKKEIEYCISSININLFSVKVL